MPRRAIFLSVLACLCLAPDAALAVTIRDATPNVAGSQIDPSVAVTPTGQRLIAAADADHNTVRVWQPSDAGGGNITWSDTVVPTAASQPAIAWNGGATAWLSTTSSDGCSSPAAITVRSYNVGAESFGAPTALGLFSAPHTAAQTWPRTVLGHPADLDHAGDPITVADEQDCTTGEHQVVVAWPGSLTRPVDAGTHPDVAVLGADGTNGTRLLIAYLADAGGGDDELRVRTCTVIGTFTLTCDASVKLEEFTPPGPVTVGTNVVPTVGAPSLACDAGVCHVAWTESASNGQRTRVFLRSATGSFTSWSPAQQVAGSSTSSQLMPSVSARGSRADVVYLDTRLGASKFETFQTSINGGARGRDISLTDGQGYNPAASATLGLRTASAEFPSASTTGVVRGYFPDESGDLGQVTESELVHGTTVPTLPLLGAGQTIGKNTSFNASSWMNYSDLDGDPITLTVDDPAHGTVVNGVYTADPSYAGTDTVTVRATDDEGAAAVASHTVTITNAEPVFDAPAPAIVDEGGAVVTVPLHAEDTDVNDSITFSVVSAGAPLNVAGRATISGSSLRLDIPAGARSLGPVRVTLRARDSTTGLPPAYADQDLSVTIRPDLATPVTPLPSVDVTGVRATLRAPVVWNDISAACLKSKPLGCHVRRVWNFGDGTSQTTTDAESIEHSYPRAGPYTGQVTTWVLWGASQVAAAPRSFSVAIHDDGRVLVSLKPTVKKVTPTARQVIVMVSAKTTGTVWVTLTYAGKKKIPAVRRQVKLKAGTTTPVRFPRISLRALKSRRATITVAGWGSLAAGMPQPTTIYRAIILR